jgi:hypothetical protein
MLSCRSTGSRAGPSARRLAGAALAAAANLGAATAAGKDFDPGYLRLCNATRCVPIEDPGVLQALSTFIFDGPRPSLVRRPSPRARAYRLGIRGGGAAGLVTSARLDRFQSYGIVCGRFRRGRWYRLPERIASELRELAASLAPLRAGAVRLPGSC